MSLQDVAAWRRANWDEDAIFAIFVRLVEQHAERVTDIQETLSGPMPRDDGNTLEAHIAWIDGQLYFIAKKLADAEMLLDVAEGFYRIPAGRSVPCTTDDGVVIPASGRGRRRKADDDPDEDFAPKYKELTDADRTIDLRAKCVPFRRLRDEFKHLHTGLIGRLYRARDLLDSMIKEAQAAGIAHNAGMVHRREPPRANDYEVPD